MKQSKEKSFRVSLLSTNKNKQNNTQRQLFEKKGCLLLLSIPIMRRILLSCILLSATCILKAQDACLNDVVNTLKDRISLSGYAQVGYTYDDAGEGTSNTFDIKRVIFMARGKITDKWSAYFMYSFANTGKILKPTRNTAFSLNSQHVSDSSKPCIPLRTRCLLLCRINKLLFSSRQLPGRYQWQ